MTQSPQTPTPSQPDDETAIEVAIDAMDNIADMDVTLGMYAKAAVKALREAGLLK